MPATNIDLGRWQVSDDATAQYLAAVGDAQPVYRQAGIVPPLALAARVVGRLLAKLSLPDGTIHSLQDIQTINPAATGATVSATAEVEPLRERGGLRFLTVNFAVADADSSRSLLDGRTTVLLPADAPSDGVAGDAR